MKMFEIEAEVVFQPFINLDKKSFMMRDVAAVIVDSHINSESIVEISKIKVNYQGEGIGSKAIQNYVNKYPNSAIIVKAGPTYESEADFLEALENGNFDSTLDRICSFYKTNNFISINDFVGYEFNVAFIYSNRIGKQIIEAIKE